MFRQLFIIECRQTVKSLIYWLIILILILDFSSQLGGLQIKDKPQKGQSDYGFRNSQNEDLIMEGTLGALAEEYCRESYTTYPIGFYKQVTLSEKEDKQIAEILKEATGLDGRQEIEQTIENWYASQKQDPDTGMMLSNFMLEPVDGLGYDRFLALMEEADDILGGGSKYGETYRSDNAEEPMTYEDAMEEYQLLVEKDRVSGGYARLFSDYMVIFLGLLPVFLSVTRSLRDKRAKMQELIYARQCPSIVIIASRYLAMTVMLIIPVLAISGVPLIKCIKYGALNGLSIDLFAFVKYTFGWLVPTIMTALAVGMFLTELTGTAAAVLAQGIWWFISVFSGVQSLDGGMYGWSLIPRHNTEMNWTGYHETFMQLAANRIFYTLFALALVVLSALIYSQKRKGRLQLHGKILADRKNASKA